MNVPIPWVQAQAWKGICHHSHQTSEGRSSGKRNRKRIKSTNRVRYKLKTAQFYIRSKCETMHTNKSPYRASPISLIDLILSKDAH